MLPIVKFLEVMLGDRPPLTTEQSLYLRQVTVQNPDGVEYCDALGSGVMFTPFSPDLTIPGHRDVFVVGDLAAVTMDDGSSVPGVAPAAIQEGQHTAKNIARILDSRPTLPFRYWDKGSLATIGRAAASRCPRQPHGP